MESHEAKLIRQAEALLHWLRARKNERAIKEDMEAYLRLSLLSIRAQKRLIRRRYGDGTNVDQIMERHKERRRRYAALPPIRHAD